MLCLAACRWLQSVPAIVLYSVLAASVEANKPAEIGLINLTRSMTTHLTTAGGLAFVACLILPCASFSQTAIQVITGGVSESFSNRPPASQWATTNVAGSITSDPATADALIEPLNVANLNTQLGQVSGPPTTAQLAQWNSAGYVQTPPTGVAATILVAKMQNATGSPVSRLSFSYLLGLANATVDTPEDAFPGHLLYISRTGAPNTWQPAFLFGYYGSAASPPATPRLVEFEIDFPTSWAVGQAMYIMWVDDNSSTNPDGLNVIDNFSVVPILDEPISFGSSGATETFDDRPVGSKWSASSITGGSSTISGDAASADTALAALSAADLSGAPGGATGTPTTYADPLWNDAGYIQTTPTGVAASLLLATLRNDSGGPLGSINITYDLGLANGDLTTPEDLFPGHRIYFSTTGGAGSWNAVGNFGYVGDGVTPATTPQQMQLTLNVPGGWAAGTLLYVVWMDDNSAANPDGLYTIDNVVFNTRTTLTNVDITLDGANHRHITFPSASDSFYVLRRGLDPTAFPDLVGMALGNGGPREILDVSALLDHQFYRVEQYPVSSSQDTDLDGMRDAYELGFPGCLDPMVDDGGGDCDQDTLTNFEEFQRGTNPIIFNGDALVINEVNYRSPAGNDDFVEIFNRSPQPVTMAGKALVFVSTEAQGEYLRIDLSTGPAELAPGGYLLIATPAITPPAGVPVISLGTGDVISHDVGVGIAIIDTSGPTVLDKVDFQATLSNVLLPGFASPISFVEGAQTSTADSGNSVGSTVRLPNGRDTDDASADWLQTDNMTPGAANLP